MGARASRNYRNVERPARAAPANNEQNPNNDTPNNQAAIVNVPSAATLASKAQEKFTTQVKKQFRKKVLGTRRKRVEISGKADQYPYWMSTHNLQKHSGDYHKNTSQQGLKYYIVQPDDHIVEGGMKIPTYFYQHLKTTMKLQLRFAETNVSRSIQELNPEYGKLKRTVRILLLNISDNENKTTDSKLSLDIKLYEQHFRARKKPQFRPMIAEMVFYDSRGNLAIMGEEFLLIIYKPKITESVDAIRGTYLRSLDTTLHGIITYSFSKCDNCSSQLPTSVQHFDEYAKLLLSKSSKELFTVKVPKQRTKGLGSYF